MKNKIFKVVIIIALIFMMTATNFLVIGDSIVSYALDSFSTNNSKVEFNAYFKNEKGERISSLDVDANNLSTNLYLYFNLKQDGYINAQVKIENSNFKLKTSESEYVNRIDGDTLVLNQINAGKEIEIPINVEFSKQEQFDINSINKETKISLDGIYKDQREKDIKIKAEKSVVLNLSKSNIEIENEIKVVTNKILKVSGEDKRVVQLSLSSKLKENKYPISRIDFEVTKPKIDGKIPEVFIAENLNSMTKVENNEKEESLLISLKNETEKPNILQWKQGTENVIVTYIYDKEVNVEDINITLKTKTTMPDGSDIKSEEMSLVLTNGIETDAVITASNYNTEPKIYKGSLYEGNNRSITTKTEVNINMINIVDGIELSEDNSLLVETENKDNSLQVRDIDMRYHETIINKDNLLKILGTEGKLTVLNQDGVEISSIDKTTKSDEQGNVIINYGDNKPTKITLKTTVPVEMGKIEIINNKIITQEQNKITPKDKQTQTQLYISNNLTNNNKVEIAKTQTTLEEAVTEARLELNKTELSTMIKNDIEMRAILKADSEAYNLYENPSLKITFPTGLKTIDIKDIKIIYNDELKIKDYSLNGNVLTVNIEGKQTKYVDSALEGATVVINAVLEFDRKTVSLDTSINMEYANKSNIGSTSANVKVVAPTDVTLISSIEGLNVEEIGQNETKEIIIPVNTSSKEIKPQIEITNNKDTAIKDVKVLGTFPTNNSNTNNMGVVLLDAISIEGAKVYYTENENATDDIQNSENVWKEQITDATLVKKYLIIIDVIEAKNSIKASYKAQIPANLEYNKVSQEGYQVTYTDSQTNANTTLKSINVKMSTGIGPKLETDIQTSLGDRKLQDGEKIHTGEIVKYSINVKNSGQEEAKNIKVKVNVPDELIYIVEDIVSDLNNPYQEMQDKVIEKEISTLAVGQEVTLEFQFKVKKEVENDSIVKLEIITKYKDLEEKHIVEKQVKKEDIGARTYYLDVKEVYEQSALNYNIVIENFSDNTIKDVNIELNQIEGVQVTGVELYKLLKDIGSDEFEKELEVKDGKINIGDLGAGETKQLKIAINVNEIKENGLVLPLGATLIVNDTKIKTNTVSLTGRIYEVVAEISEEKAGGYITADDILNYNILLKNIGNTEAKVKFVDIIPEQLYVKEITIDGVNIEDIDEEQFEANQDKSIANSNDAQIFNQLEKDLDTYEAGGELTNTEDVVSDEISNEIERTIIIPANKDMTINIVASVDGQNGEFEEEVKIKNKAQVLSVADKMISETSDVFHIIRNTEEEPDIPEPDGNDDNSDNDNENNNNNENNNGNNNGNDNDVDGDSEGKDEENNNQNEKFIISGTIWLDTDRDGQVTRQDQFMEGKTVKLLNTNTGKVVKETKTSDNGEYLFTDIEKGEYMVISEYDPSQYALVEYQKEGIELTRSSSAISQKMQLDGEEKTYAVTDILKVEDSSIPYKNIGFVKAEKFDLKLEKFVSKISVQNSAGTTVNEYKDETLAKIELDAKVLNGTTVIIEYKIKASNVGEVEGYVKNIVDYVPSDLKFNSELNKDWYQSGENLYSTSIANQKLLPGESKELTLVLMKTMTENNTGMVNNTAEIEDAYNEFGVNDINSVPANRTQGENDMGAADVIISIRTGATTIYITITMIIVLVALSVVIIPIIKKRKKTGYSKLDKI